MKERNSLVSSLCAVTVMIKTKTWYGAKTDALCHSISVYLNLICLNHLINPHHVFLLVTQTCENHISVNERYTKFQSGTKYVKHATVLPMGATINHAKSSACSHILVLMSGRFSSSTTQIPINISAVVFGT